MKKYIRTKNRVYEVIKNELGECIKIDGGFILLEDVKDKIIKQADTIEELCDEFVTLENLDGSVWHSLNFTLCDDLRNDKDNDGVYGAIWIDGKGLIYVAKINEKGELVLI